MIELTIKEVLESAEQTKGQCLYVYRDRDTYLYVGCSIHPFHRLREHVGEDPLNPCPDMVGTVIIDNLPLSLQWTVEIYTVIELNELLCGGRAFIDEQHLIETLESHFIERLTPCLNTKGKRNTKPLPGRYAKGKIANAGVKLD